MRVLLVEDDVTAARGIAMMLKSGGIIVDSTDTGEEALELLRHYDYDVVVLDLMLPDMEGYEVVRRMRAARQETPVLILSGLSRPAAKVKGLRNGSGRLHYKAIRQSRAGSPNAGCSKAQ